MEEKDGDILLTYNDFISADNKTGFISRAISEYRAGSEYRTALEAQKYYARENTAILKRLTYLQKYGNMNSKVVFHKICSGFFPKFIKQLSQYLLGNGVTLPAEIKEMLGVNFDSALQKMGMQALVDGVNWGFWNVDRLLVFRATEFVPLFDEQTGELRAGIRFWQLSQDKPMYIELYEEDGITKFAEKETGVLMLTEKKTPYIRTIRADLLGAEVTDTENYPSLPIFPLYANEIRQSEFTHGIKSMIDAYDFINSDLVDGITQVEGVYWVIKNYGGNDVAELLSELQELKATYTQDESGADSHSIEIPYQAKQTALALLKKQLYADFMAFDTESMTGGSLTNVAINVAKTDFDLKADIFEWQCINFIASILNLLGLGYQEIRFKRRSITNDTELIENISTMLGDGYIDKEMAVKLCPLIPDSMQEELLLRIQSPVMEEPEEEIPAEETAEEEE